MDEITDGAASESQGVEPVVTPSGVEPVVFGDEDDGDDGGAELEEPVQRRGHTVPVAVLQKERQQRQRLEQQVQALSDELAANKAKISNKVEDEDSSAAKSQAREQWRKALGVAEQEAQIEQLMAKIEEMNEGMGYTKQQAQYVESQYYDNVGGFILEKFYGGNNYPVTDVQYAHLFTAEMRPDEQAAIQDRDLSCLEDIARRVHKGFNRKPVSMKEAKDYRNVQNLPKVPGRGGGPSPEPAPEPVTGKDLHRAASEAFASIKARR